MKRMAPFLVFMLALFFASAGEAQVHVRAYTRKDGTVVRAYDRRGPSSYSKGSTASSPADTDFVPAVVSPSTAATPTNSGKLSEQEFWRSTGFAPRKQRPTAKANESSSRSNAQSQERDSRGRFKRSSAAKREFMRESGYPNGRPGYVIDHIIPLKRGGADAPSNMQWQTIEAAKAKDKWE